jgi:predicted nucleic acid-binding protein
MKYLLDASALMLLIKKAEATTTVECLQESLILNLTFYEIGNAVWKESTLLKYLTPQEATKLKTLAQTVLAKIEQATNEGEDFQKILEIAQDQKLTFYDSSYIFYAKQNGLQLVTEDKQLETKAKKYVKVQTTATLLSPQI